MSDSSIDIHLVAAVDVIKSGQVTLVADRTDWCSENRKSTLPAVSVATQNTPVVVVPNRQINRVWIVAQYDRRPCGRIDNRVPGSDVTKAAKPIILQADNFQSAKINRFLLQQI